jgi:hypothetical protein
VAAFHDGPGQDRKLPTAIAAMEQPLAMSLTFHPQDVERSAVRAIGTVGPTRAFKPLASLVVIVEFWGGQVRGIG